MTTPLAEAPVAAPTAVRWRHGLLVQAAGSYRPRGAGSAEPPHPEAIVAIQRQHVEAGADCITTNTFNTNRLKLANAGATVAEVYAAAAANARVAGAPLVAGDIGPTGALLEPLGTLTFDEAFDIFSEQARAAEAAGCDLIVVETMADLLEAKAAVLAAVESTTLPVFATMTFGEDGRTFLGTTPACRHDAVGAQPRPWTQLLARADGAGAARGGARAARPRPRHGATQRGLAPHSGWRDRLRRGP
ncbi:MAG: homocysteine S-methyltransferase family protein [Coriobacteriaceae bacterium]